MTDIEKIPWPVQGAVYASGLFNHSMQPMVMVLLPLWVVTLNPSPFMIGIVLGSRFVLPILFSIHGGAMMDRLGARPVMLGVGLIGAVVPLLIPVAPWIWALIVLQMLGGLADTIGWSGTQTLIGQLMKGSALYASRLSFCIRIGHFAGPPLVGIAWDVLGPWGAFIVLSLWASCAFIAAWLIPSPAVSGKARSASDTHRSFKARDLLPRMSDYIAAFKLLAIPGVAFVIMISVLRHSGISIQGSFYVVYLEGIGISGTLIGLFLSAGAVLGAGGALLTGWFVRFFKPTRLLIATVVAGIVLIVITPLLGTVLLLLVAAALRGGVMGMSQPLMISTLARYAGAESQGKSVGLRITANRIVNMLFPVIMGVVVEFAGLENGFYIMGTLALSAVLLVAVHARRRGGFGEA
jgi:MFS family permease